MALGRPGVSSVDFEGLKDRALQIVRRSRDPSRCLQLMRAKAAAFLESGGLGVVRKEISVENRRGSDSCPEFLPSVSTAAKVRESTPVPEKKTLIEDEIFEDEKSGTGTAKLALVTVAVGSISIQTVTNMQVSGIADAEYMAPIPDMGRVVLNPASTLLGVLICIGGLILRSEDKPPDPGKSVLQAKGNIRSAQTCMTGVPRIGPHQEKKIEDGLWREIADHVLHQEEAPLSASMEPAISSLVVEIFLFKYVKCLKTCGLCSIMVSLGEPGVEDVMESVVKSASPGAIVSNKRYMGTEQVGQAAESWNQQQIQQILAQPEKKRVTKFQQKSMPRETKTFSHTEAQRFYKRWLRSFRAEQRKMEGARARSGCLLAEEAPETVRSPPLMEVQPIQSCLLLVSSMMEELRVDDTGSASSLKSIFNKGQMLDAEQNVNGRLLEKSKTKVQMEGPLAQEEVLEEENCHEEEATSHGAAGTLTGAEDRACQEP